MNKIQIDLENFQSIKKATLEFVQGINVIVGQSNSGKSATLRAIKGAILNPRSSQKYIKNGETSLSVTIHYLGNDIIWVRTNKDSKYEVNGEVYQKVGNSNLSKILDKSGFVLDDNENLMNVESELELPFPFDKGPVDLFKLFEKSIFCVSDSALVLKTIKADEDTISKDKAQANYELSRFKSKLDALSELSEVIDIDKLKKGKIKLEEYYFNYDKLKEEYTKVIEGYKASKALKETKEEVVIPNLDKYTTLYKNVEKLQSVKLILQVLMQNKDEVAVVVNVEDFTKLKEDIEKLENAKEILTVLSKEHEPANTIDTEGYEKLKADYNKFRRLIVSYKAKQEEILKIQTKQKQLKEQLNEFKVCPLCGHELQENK